MAPERAVALERGRLIEVEIPAGRPSGVSSTLRVANGHTSPRHDGERIAVGCRELGEQDPDREVLEIRTFDGQVTGRWADPVASEEPVSIAHLSWSPDGQRAAFELQFEDGTETRILDVTAEDGDRLLEGVARWSRLAMLHA